MITHYSVKVNCDGFSQNIADGVPVFVESPNWEILFTHLSGCKPAVQTIESGVTANGISDSSRINFNVSTSVMKLTYPMIGMLALAAAVALILYLLWPGFGSDEPWSDRKARLQTAAEDARLVVDAIGQYEQFKGKPPKNLEALIPDHIRWIPEPGIPECSDFKYLNFGPGSISVVWYDLGPHSDTPASTLQSSIDGDPRHAILLITLSQKDVVVDARFERMPENAGKLAFDAEQWKKGSNRMQMALQLPDYANLMRIHRSSLVDLLGPPDGVRILRDSPWELRVICPQGLNERELFVYWPTGKYPEKIYGGTTEPVGDWIYIHK